jgi:peptidoglycan/xylan/chitin deacetylase (PgdA/CDA1 family)
LKYKKFKFVDGLRGFARWLCVSLFTALTVSGAAGQQRAKVAITVDDLPVHGDLPANTTRAEIAKKMIDAFKAKDVPGVYGFVNAKNIGVNGDTEKDSVLKIWADSGFPLGNHTFSHIDLNTASVQAFEDEIVANESVLQGLMGARDWHWLRYPYLHEGDTLEKRHAVRKYLADHGYKIAQITLDFGDYAWNNPYARCVAKQDTQAIAWLKASYVSTASDDIALDRKLSMMLFGRDIKYVLLLHIGALDSIMLPDLLDLFKKQGFDFISLEEAEKDPAYQSDPDAALLHGGTLLEQLTEAKHLKYPPHVDRPMDKLDAICR